MGRSIQDRVEEVVDVRLLDEVDDRELIEGQLKDRLRGSYLSVVFSSS